jgi:hypothetical protein
MCPTLRTHHYGPSVRLHTHRGELRGHGKWQPKGFDLLAHGGTSMHTDRVASLATADDRELRTRFVRFRINAFSYL